MRMRKIDMVLSMISAMTLTAVSSLAETQFQHPSGVVMPESVFSLDSEALLWNVQNVVERGDGASALKVARYYSNCLSKISAANVWLYMSAQLGNREAEFELFTGGLMENESSVFSASAVKELKELNAPHEVVEYVLLQQKRCMGMQHVDFNNHNALPTTNKVARIKEFPLPAQMQPAEGSFSAKQQTLVAYRMPRGCSSTDVSGYILSFAAIGGLPGEWLSVIEQYGDDADRNKLLMLNVCCHQCMEVSELVRCVEASLKKILSEEKVQLATTKGRLVKVSKADLLVKNLKKFLGLDIVSPDNDMQR